MSLGLTLGYDIGCCFKTTLNKSSLGPKAHTTNYTCLVSAFHGHEHNRLYQLAFLANYVEGLRLEDLEGCERFFSMSNTLASSTQYSSIFHRCQAIMEYSKHKDTFETYQNLSMYPPFCIKQPFWSFLGTFLLNNYKQALEILDTRLTVAIVLVKIVLESPVKSGFSASGALTGL
jgi:hypothetical protein